MPVVVHDRCRMVQTMQNCLEVPQVQFLRGCGRRCVHAATSSRQSRDGVQIRSSTSSRRTELGFLPHFDAFFALRPAGRESQGGGDAGSLLPGVLPPQLGAFVMGYGQTHLINTQVRTTTTTTTTQGSTRCVHFSCRPVLCL